MKLGRLQQHVQDNREWILNTFEYLDGELIRRTTVKRAGTSSKTYRFVGVNAETCLEHLVIWMMFNDTLPEAIDHIDGNKQNNRIENLRASTKQKNEANTGPRKNNSTGYKGIRKHKNGRYTVQMNVGKTQIYISSHRTPEEAALVYNHNAKEWYGEHAKLNDVWIK